jgi:hypothetical protein
MPINVNPLWPTLFVVAGFLLAVRQSIGIRKTREFSSTSRLFLLVAASLFTVAGLLTLSLEWSFSVGELFLLALACHLRPSGPLKGVPFVGRQNYHRRLVPYFGYD